ncbi:unnamed protein product [Protopolystoma xenopodis]|uniref:Uncharacterized protein n=1 Tax=Protopolystoma xenopodis TaxID=117903 RepID=A0A448X9S8_9PLAT|nr:unnamed protein product [Protopolystoma xenopodis]
MPITLAASASSPPPDSDSGHGATTEENSSSLQSCRLPVSGLGAEPGAGLSISSTGWLETPSIDPNEGSARETQTLLSKTPTTSGSNPNFPQRSRPSPPYQLHSYPVIQERRLQDSRSPVCSSDLLATCLYRRRTPNDRLSPHSLWQK